MSIVGTAAVPSNGNLRKAETFELPKVLIPGSALDAEVFDLATRITRRIAEGKIGREQIESALRAAEATESSTEQQPTQPPLPCPSFCERHKHMGVDGDRDVWSHETSWMRVATTHVGETVDTEAEVTVWAERFDDEAKPGTAVVQLMAGGGEPVGMTADQADQIAVALQAAAVAVRQATGTDGWAGAQDYAAGTVEESQLDDTGKEQAAKILRLLPREVVEAVADELTELWAAGWVAGAARTAAALEPKKPEPEPVSKHETAGPDLSLVWPPKVCPAWCMYAADPATGHAERSGPDLPESRYHIHTHYAPDAWTPSSDVPEPGTVDLTLEEPIVYPTKDGIAAEHQYLSAELTQHYRSVEPEISLAHHAGPDKDGGSHVDMTPAEARRLGEMLIHLADLADQSNTHRSLRAA